MASDTAGNNHNFVKTNFIQSRLLSTFTFMVWPNAIGYIINGVSKKISSLKSIHYINCQFTLFLGHPIDIKCQVKMQDAFCITIAQYNSASTPEHYLLLLLCMSSFTKYFVLYWE